MKKTLYSVIMMTLLSGSIVGTALADNYESNDTLSSAYKIPTQTVATPYGPAYWGGSAWSYLSSPTDVDYFTFRGHGKSVVLGSPSGYDYDLYAYDSAGNLVASSTNTSGTDTVLVDYNNVYFKVVSKDGRYSDTDAYSVTFYKRDVWVP